MDTLNVSFTVSLPDLPWDVQKIIMTMVLSSVPNQLLRFLQICSVSSAWRKSLSRFVIGGLLRLQAKHALKFLITFPNFLELEIVNIREELDSMSSSLSLPVLRSLKLQLEAVCYNTPRSLPFENLQTLTVSLNCENAWMDICPLICRLTKLRSLTLRGSSFEFLQPRILTSLQPLKSIYLKPTDSTSFSDTCRRVIKLLELRSCFPSLHSLSLVNCRIDPPQVHQFQHLTSLAVSVILENEELIRTFGSSVSQLTNLRKLELPSWKQKNKNTGMVFLRKPTTLLCSVAWSALSHLTSLVCHTYVSANDLEYLLSHNRNKLEEFEWEHGNELAGDVAFSLLHQYCGNSLKSIAVKSESTLASLPSQSVLSRFTSLHRLMMRKLPVQELNLFSACVSLQHLWIESTAVVDESSLVSLLALEKLSELHISFKRSDQSNAVISLDDLHTLQRDIELSLY